MRTDQHLPQGPSLGQIEKKASQLRVGDRIVGNTNYMTIDVIRPGIAGIFFPIIECTDATGRKLVVDTGSTPRLQDSTFTVDARINQD